MELAALVEIMFTNVKVTALIKIIIIVARQKISAASAGDYLLFVVLLGSLESPPSIMVTRNLWSARV